MGLWRTVRPYILRDVCTNCGFCRGVCPVNTIQYEQKQIRVGYENCVGCGICAADCTIHAITMLPKEIVRSKVAAES